MKLKRKLLEEIEIQQIKDRVFSMKNNKKLGPDRYSHEFFKVFGEEIKYLMLNTFKEYLGENRLKRNFTFKIK